MLHLQTSNQSPEAFHFGILLIFVVAVAVDEAVAGPYHLILI